MSKIKLYKAKFYDSHEGWWHYDEYNINCGSDGRFYTTIADEDVSIANNIINGCPDYSLAKNKIYSYQLRALENILDNILKTKKTLVKTEEFVIEYAFAGEIAYVKDDKGGILPCGKFGQENYKWINLYYWSKKMSCNYKEPSREEKLKSAIKYLQYLEKELQSAKGYWKKLTTKQEILRQLNYIEELEAAND